MLMPRPENKPVGGRPHVTPMFLWPISWPMSSGTIRFHLLFLLAVFDAGDGDDEVVLVDAALGAVDGFGGYYAGYEDEVNEAV